MASSYPVEHLVTPYGEYSRIQGPRSGRYYDNAMLSMRRIELSSYCCNQRRRGAARDGVAAASALLPLRRDAPRRFGIVNVAGSHCSKQPEYLYLILRATTPRLARRWQDEMRRRYLSTLCDRYQPARSLFLNAEAPGPPGLGTQRRKTTPTTIPVRSTI